MTTTSPGRLRFYAFALTKVRGGWRVDNPIIEYRSRGEADIGSLRLLGNYGEADSITLVDRELRAGEVLTAADLKRDRRPVQPARGGQSRR